MPAPRLLYVSYDGAAEPLGQSQVIAYLGRLARSWDVTLLSFEKPESADRHAAVAVQLLDLGVTWISLGYHARPPLASTAFDVLSGVRAIRREHAAHPFDVVAARSYVAALVVTRAIGPATPFVFDIRGFWADERVDGGFWPRGGAMDRLVRSCERGFFARADAVVTLTHASVPFIRPLLRSPDVPVGVIPTCADVERFSATQPRAGGPHAVWSGSLGPWYRFDLAVLLARELGLPMSVLTRQVDEAQTALDGLAADVRTVPFEEMPSALHAGDVALSLIRPSFSKIASAPTRVAECLAAGQPIVTCPGVGDLESIVTDHGVGVTLEGESPEAVGVAARRLLELAGSQQVRDRCRRVARDLLDVDDGARRYDAVYRALLDGGRPAHGPGGS